jgi:hypothetical protein
MNGKKHFRKKLFQAVKGGERGKAQFYRELVEIFTINKEVEDAVTELYKTAQEADRHDDTLDVSECGQHQ